MNKAQFKQFIKEEASKYIDALNVQISKPKKEGSVGAAVSVKASGGEGKGQSMGAKKPSFETKSTSPKSKAPFTQNPKSGLNTLDKEDTSVPKNGAKAYVEAGQESKEGQKKANFSTKPKNVTDKIAAIAKAIQLPESFKNKKEMDEFILQSARKICKSL